MTDKDLIFSIITEEELKKYTYFQYLLYLAQNGVLEKQSLIKMIKAIVVKHCEPDKPKATNETK